MTGLVDAPTSRGSARVGAGPEVADWAGCDRVCCDRPADWTLSYPDGRLRVCTDCLGDPAAALAEPLDVDDDLAVDRRGFGERQDLR